MAILDTIRKEIAKGFKGKLRKGTLYSAAVTSVTDGVPVITYTTSTFDGIRDSFSAVYANMAGIPITDARILIIAGSLPAGVAPKKDDKITIESLNFQVRQITAIDPATATYQLAAFAIDQPPGAA